MRDRRCGIFILYLTDIKCLLQLYNKIKFKFKDGINTNGKKAVLICLESKLLEDLKKMRANGTPLTAVVILTEMKDLYKKEFEIDDDEYGYLQ